MKRTDILISIEFPIIILITVFNIMIILVTNQT